MERVSKEEDAKKMSPSEEITGPCEAEKSLAPPKPDCRSVEPRHMIWMRHLHSLDPWAWPADLPEARRKGRGALSISFQTDGQGNLQGHREQASESTPGSSIPITFLYEQPKQLKVPGNVD